MFTRWIKIPTPSQFRGEGEWFDLSKVDLTLEYWLYCKNTNFLPVAVTNGEHPDSVQVIVQDGNDNIRIQASNSSVVVTR